MTALRCHLRFGCERAPGSLGTRGDRDSVGACYNCWIWDLRRCAVCGATRDACDGCEGCAGAVAGTRERVQHAMSARSPESKEKLEKHTTNGYADGTGVFDEARVNL